MKVTDRWKQFFEETKHSPPRKHLKKAVEFLDARETALDLGAGPLRDVKYLLEIGFKEVIAVDSEEFVKYFATELSEPRLKVHIKTFAEYEFPEQYFDLINAQYSLPFAEKESFNYMFRNLQNSLKPKGIFAGTFFGVEDGWNKPRGKANVFHSIEELEQMFKGWKILVWEEEKLKDSVVGGDIKDWHRFHIIAQKP